MKKQKSKIEELLDNFERAVYAEAHQSERWMHAEDYAKETAYKIKTRKAVMRYMKKLEDKQK